MKKDYLMMKPLLAVFAWVTLFSVYASGDPMKFGKVDKADLEMKCYPLDSTASAVILCNYGYFDAKNFQFVHQIRIKILKEEGKSWGNVIAPAAKDAEVRGQTVTIENGVPVVTKLKKESTFVEKITKGVYRVRAAMPNVKVGSVIDVEVYYKGLPRNWRFQEHIPVRWSELVIEPNEYISFRKNFKGYVPLAVSEDGRWVTKDVPAFKSENYLNNADNYITQFDIEISMVHVPGQLYEEFATTWEAVEDVLRKDSDFGVHLSSISFFLSDAVRQIKKAATSPEQKLSMAYDEVKKIKWNKTSSVWVSNSMLGTAYSKKTGNASDINLTLALLLRKLDIDANPVVLSTRDNGLLPAFSVSLSKFNYVIVQAKIGENTYLLDATDELLPLGMLPERAINGRGLVVKEGAPEWVDLAPTGKDKIITMLSLDLKPDGTLKGQWSKSYFDYGAFDLREKYKSFNSRDEYLKSIENLHSGLSINQYELENLDSLNNPVKETCEIVLKNRTSKVGDKIYLEALLFGKMDENPFKLEQRVYPVDFTTPLERRQIMQVKIPDGYTVEQLPQPVKMSTPENGAGFSMQAMQQENNIVQIVYKFAINKPVFYQPEYDVLKEFFNQLVKKQADMLILKKI